MTTSRRFGSLAFAKQSAIGSPEAAPLFSVPIISGGLGPRKEWDDLPRIGSNLSRLGRFPTGAMGGGTVRILAHPEALGLLLAQVIGTTGVSGGGPYTHTYDFTDDYQFALSFWSSVGSVVEVGQTWRLWDGFINRLRIEGTTRRNVEVELDVTTFQYNPLDAMPAVTGTGSSAEDDEPRFKYIGSDVKLDPSADVATVDYPNAERVMFEVDRAPEYRYGPSLTPTLIVPDRLVNFDAGWVYDSDIGGWQYLLDEYVGSLTGTTPDQSTPQGSFDVKFGRHPHDATKYLQVVSNGSNWQYTLDRPDAEAQPGVLEMEATGIVVAPSADHGGTGTDEAEVTLINDFASDYDA